MPDIGTRLFTKQLLDHFDIPIFYLGDWDPYGIEILLVFCFGTEVNFVLRKLCLQLLRAETKARNNQYRASGNKLAGNSRRGYTRSA